MESIRLFKLDGILIKIESENVYKFCEKLFDW